MLYCQWQLNVRRYKFVTDEDLELWRQESEEADEEEGITSIGPMKPIAGIVPVREILQNSREDGLIHTASSDRDEQIQQMINSKGKVLYRILRSTTITKSTLLL